MKTKQEIKAESAINFKRLFLPREKGGLGITQTELSKRTDISQNTLSKIANQKTALSSYVASAIVSAYPEVRFDFLMGKDNFMTVGELIHANTSGREEQEEIVLELMKSCGYVVRDINMLCLSYGSGSLEYMSYPFGMTPEEAFRYERKAGGRISEDVEFEDFIHYTAANGNSYFFYKPVIELTSPRGSKRYFYNQVEFSSILREIIEFTDFKCSIQFRTVADATKHIYDWH